MYKKIHAFSLPVATAFVFGSFQPITYARTVPASVTRTANPADQGCFPLSFSSITNNCGIVKRVDIPLVVDTSGTVTVQVRAQGAGIANNVQCELLAWDGSTFATSGLRALPVFGSPQLISLTNNIVFTGDSVFVGCNVSPGGILHTVIY